MLSYRKNWPFVLQKIIGILVRTLGAVIFGLTGALSNLFMSVGVLRKRQATGAILCIAAGARGWEAIEFQELSRSAREYLGEQRVVEVVVSSPATYLTQVCRALTDSEVTHYLFDPRTGSQKSIASYFQSLAIGTMLAYRGVIPIAYCTDISERNWRLQVALVTATTGVCVCFMDSVELSRIFPHRRVIGPSIMPFSVETFEKVSALRRGSKLRNPGLVSFVGSLYEPRTTTLLKIQSLLAEIGIRFDVSTRKMGEPKAPENTYWEALTGSHIQLTTTSQIRHSGADMSEVNQLVYRATETLVCGAALVIEEVKGMSTFFQDKEHLYSFTTPEEAVSIIRALLSDRSKLSGVKLAGHRKIEEIVRGQIFWRTIDSALGEFSMQRGIPSGRV